MDADRRYVCSRCATKWFILAERVDLPELTECAACSGPLVPLFDEAWPGDADGGPFEGPGDG